MSKGVPTDMEKHVVGLKILKKEQVLISVFLIAILVLSSGSMVAFAKSNAHVVKPNGIDDTADIQAALNACVGAGPWCTVQLVKGTYYVTSQITVYGFQGSFVGMGQGVTNIEVPVSLPPPAAAYNQPDLSSVWWLADPGPSNPWPDIFTFVGGTFSISGMTITDTTYNAIGTPGWYSYPNTPFTALEAAIYITGGIPQQPQASAVVDHVTVVGGPGPTISEGTNMWNAIAYGGAFVVPSQNVPGGNFNDYILLPGTFSLTNSVFESVATGSVIGDTGGATATVCYNSFSNDPGPLIFFLDVSNTKMTFCGNQASDVGVAGGYGYNAIEGLESVVDTVAPFSPSTVYILNNNFQLSNGASAVELQDASHAYFGVPGTLNAVILGNNFQDGYAGGNNWYYSVIYSMSLKSTTVSANYIAGGGSPGVSIAGWSGTVSGNTITGAYTGVWLDLASRDHVLGNVIKNSVEYGIAVTSINAAGYPVPPPTSSNNKITGNFITGTAVGGFDLYWDSTGTGNVWHGNFCQTSSPPGLC
jgi:hypothetical protein